MVVYDQSVMGLIHNSLNLDLPTQPVNLWPYLHNDHITPYFNLIGLCYRGNIVVTNELPVLDQHSVLLLNSRLANSQCQPWTDAYADVRPMLGQHWNVLWVITQDVVTINSVEQGWE